MHMSAHQLQQYYQPQWVPSMGLSALVTWYKHHKLAHTKISQNFWLTPVIENILNWFTSFYF